MSQLIKTNLYKKEYNVLAKYKLCRLSMDKIFNTILKDRERLNRPFGMRLTLHLDSNQLLVHRNFINRIKSALDGKSYSLIYRYELSSTSCFHIEMLLIYDKTSTPPKTIFNCLRTKLSGLEHTSNFIYHKPSSYREENSLIGCIYGHEIKNNDSVFKDFIERSSYLAKKDDEKGVKRFKKFGIIKS